MSDLMSLTQVRLHDLQVALANRKAAKKALADAVKEYTPHYKLALNLRWWNFLRKRMTPEQLLEHDVAESWWTTKADLLYRVGLLPKDIDISQHENYESLQIVLALVEFVRPVFHVSEDIIRFINKWKTK